MRTTSTTVPGTVSNERARRRNTIEHTSNFQVSSLLQRSTNNSVKETQHNATKRNGMNINRNSFTRWAMETNVNVYIYIDIKHTSSTCTVHPLQHVETLQIANVTKIRGI